MAVSHGRLQWQMMTKNKKPSLADYVEAAERREAPHARVRANGYGARWGIWVGLIVLTVILAVGALFFLNYKKII